MFLEFINTITSNKHKLLSFSNLPLLFYQPVPFLGKMYPLPIFGHPLIEAGGRNFQKLSHLWLGGVGGINALALWLGRWDKPEKGGLM